MENYFLQLAEQIENIRARKYAYRQVSMKRELKTIEFWRSVVCECLGTFFYVFLTVSCTLQWQDGVAPGVIYTALLHGIATAVLVQCFGHISGGHMNPTVTCAMVVTCKVSPLRGLFYFLAQGGGAIAGTSLLYGMVPPVYRGDMGLAKLHGHVTLAQTVGIQLMTSFLYVFTFFATVDPNRPTLGSQPLAVGISMVLGYLSGYRYSDCLINPTRALGPAFITNTWNKQWVFWAGPLIGGALAGLLYEFVFDPTKRGRYIKQEDEEKLESAKQGPTSADASPVHSTGSFGSVKRKYPNHRPRGFGRPAGPNNSGHENRAYAYETTPQCDYEMDRLTDEIEPPGLAVPPRPPSPHEANPNVRGYEQPKASKY